MQKIKEFQMGKCSINEIRVIDTNILIAMCQLYYRGKCVSSEDDPDFTERFKKYIIEIRKNRISNEFSINELCYDYNSNQLNVEQMNKVMIAYDNLIMNMSDNEILNHKGTSVPEAKKNSKRMPIFKSIYESNLPSIMFGENKNILNAFYGTYLVILKIYTLYFKKISGINKIKALFDFMTNELNCFFEYEFNIATYLFICQNDKNNIAQRVLKPNMNMRIDYVIDAVFDMFQYRMMRILNEISISSGMYINPIFVTLDIGLQKYFENNLSYDNIICKENSISIDRVIVDVRQEYKDEWGNFYNQKMMPYMKSIFFKNNKYHILCDEILKKIILQYENELYHC